MRSKNWFTLERVAMFNCNISASVLRILSVLRCRVSSIYFFTVIYFSRQLFSIKHNQFFPLQCYWTLWIIGIDCDSQKVWNQIGGWDIIVAPRRGSCLMDFWTQKVKKWRKMEVGKTILKSLTDRNAVRAEASMVTSYFFFQNDGLCHWIFFWRPTDSIPAQCTSLDGIPDVAYRCSSGIYQVPL